MRIEKKKKILFFVIAQIMLCVAFTKVFVVSYIPSSSMSPTLNVGDILIGDKISYKVFKPQRGDLYSFYYPDDETLLLIKRVIGLPGDEIYITGGTLYINGAAYEEPYIKERMVGTFGPYVVPKDHYFMLGDNRLNSKDSRYWKNPFVSENELRTKQLFKISPTFEII